MKLMYVACNPTGAVDLMVEREITDLQRLFLKGKGESVSLISYPKLPIEELPLEIGEHQPDVIHISAHGARNELEMANSDGSSVKLTAVSYTHLDVYKRQAQYPLGKVSRFG